MPSLDIGFGGAYGLFHAAYGKFNWMEKLGDPTFKYSVAGAQVYGSLAPRLASADVLLFDYEDYGRAIQKYLGDLENELKKNYASHRLGPRGIPRTGFARAAQPLRGLPQSLRAPPSAQRAWWQ